MAGPPPVAAARHSALLGGGSTGPAQSGAILVSRERVVAPPDRLICADDSRLLQALQVHMGAGSEEDLERLRLLQHLLLGISWAQAAELSWELLEGFAALASPATAQREGTLHADYASLVPPPAVLPTTSGAGSEEGLADSPPGSPKEQAALAKAPASPPGSARQLAFLRGLCAAIQAAGYQLLTKQEWEAALCENFLFTLPITADYSALDPTLVPPLEQLAPAGSSPPDGLPRLPPQLAGRALVWHRGADVVRASTPAWSFKLDCLVSFWLLQPLWAALAWLAALFGLRLRPHPLPGVTSRPFAQPPAALPAVAGVAAVAQKPGAPVSSTAASKQAAEEAQPRGRIIERCTFARAFPSGRAVWRQLAQPVQLQEACFQDVVLLYRPAGAAVAAAQAATEAHRHGRLGRSGRKGAAAGASSSDGGKGSAAGAQVRQQEGLQGVEESVGGASDEACLVLKQFRRIPLADLEMVLPGVRVHLPPNLYISLIFTLLAGLAAALAALWQGVWGAGLLRTLGFILATRAYQMYVYIINERTAIVKHATKLLYDRTAASQEAVLHTLAAELAGQRARELLLCYCVLLEAGVQLEATEVGARCEGLLHRHLGLRHVALDAGRPLGQLVQWRLAEQRTKEPSVAEAPQAPVAAVPLEQAVQVLKGVWSSLAELQGYGERAEPAGHAMPSEPAALAGSAQSTAAAGPAEHAEHAEHAERAEAQLAVPTALPEGAAAPAALPAAPNQAKEQAAAGAATGAADPARGVQSVLGGSIPAEQEPQPFKPAAIPSGAAETDAALEAPANPAAAAGLPVAPTSQAAAPAGFVAGKRGAVTVERMGEATAEGSPRAGKAHSFLGRLLHST